jgi:hypothetical protein
MIQPPPSPRSRTRRRPAAALAFAALVAAAMLAPAASARTITLPDESTDRAAAICAAAPRVSWAGIESSAGFFMNHAISIRKDTSFLLQIPIDQVPPGNRIIRAELLMPLSYCYSPEPRLHIWRIVPAWGVGVCNEYRMTRPKAEKWAVPGAQGNSTDRATKPTTIVSLRNGSDPVANVTEDVELWYTGAAANNGWLFTFEDDAVANFLPPCGSYRGSWKLRITYEPQ